MKAPKSYRTMTAACKAAAKCGIPDVYCDYAVRNGAFTPIVWLPEELLHLAKSIQEKGVLAESLALTADDIGILTAAFNTAYHGIMGGARVYFAFKEGVLSRKLKLMYDDLTQKENFP